jgi:predicted transcriptional regulator
MRFQPFAIAKEPWLYTCGLILSFVIRLKGQVMNATKAKRDVLFSIHPFYADKILDGQKTVELRRKFPEFGTSGSTALIYATSPVRAVVGTARIKTVFRLSLSKLWKAHGAAACIARGDFDGYFAGQDYGFAIMLDSAKQLKSQLAASVLEVEFGIVPPQSYRYLDEERVALLTDGRLQTIGRYKRSDSAGRPPARTSVSR